MSKKFLVPVGLAATALLANNAGAITKSELTESDNKSTTTLANLNSERNGEITHIAEYLRGDEKHELLIKKSDMGLIFAGHGSHSSHGSHGSHRSGR
jgi:hypothetical protein